MIDFLPLTNAWLDDDEAEPDRTDQRLRDQGAPTLPGFSDDALLPDADRERRDDAQRRRGGAE